MTGLSFHRHRRRDDGIAMLYVIGVSTVVLMLVAAMFTIMLRTQTQTRYQGNITDAQAAAEAGINDWVYTLNQTNQTTGVPNWTTYPAQCSITTTPRCGATIGKSSYSGYISPYTDPVTNTVDPTKLVITMTGQFPANTGDTRTLRVVVAQDPPAAFKYSMFASKGIDIHHHNSSWLSPQVITTGVHSNGYINIDYSAEFTVQTMEAVGNITFQKGGGSTPGGSIPAGGYNWLDSLTNACYPGASAPACITNYSGNATIYGEVSANSVTMGNRGQVLPVPPNTQTETGQWITRGQGLAGDIHAATATLNGATYSSASTKQWTQANGCAQCQGTGGVTAGAGTISGTLTTEPNYAPPVLPFPSLDYSSTYRVRAASYNPSHVFASSSAFFSFITNPANNLYRWVDSNGVLQTSAAAAGNITAAPNVILLDGEWDITSGGLTLDWGTLKSMVNSATGKGGPAPIIIVRGALVVEAGNVSLQSGLVVVGRNNNLNFLRWTNSPGPNQWTNRVDTSRNSTGLLDPAATEPGVLAAGGTISSSDYDTDSPWNSPSLYEPMKATPIYVRGLVYAATWDPVAKVSTPQNMHWHNFDPKNIIKIYGAQVGAQLHDCNAFSFTYDPLVQKAFGFGGATTARIVDYQELGR